MLRKLEEALSDYQQLSVLFPDNDGVQKSFGVVLWWLRRRFDAIHVWQNALETEFTDAAGGVEIPALLFFAATRTADARLEEEAKALLKSRWSRGKAKSWPGPIAGFLLRKLDSATFLQQAIFQQPVLEARRLCKAHFWVGVLALRDGDEGSYVHNLQKAVEDEAPEHRAVVLEPEYWLATAELETSSK
jgi:hypothetical protein